MAKDPAFLLYYKDMLVSVSGWDADAIGWYFLLLCQQADKPEGLPDDIESLATLANVKNSQYDRFKHCWQRTLQAKFETNAEGLLVNKVQQKALDKRRNYTEKQTLRGLVGSFIKRAKAENELSEQDIKTLSSNLFKENNKEDMEIRYKRTLIALLGNVNANVNINGSKGNGGEGEKPLESVFDVFEIDVLKNTSDKEAFCMQNKITVEKYNELASAFINEQRIIGTAGWKGTKETKSHMINWMRRRFADNKKDNKTTSIASHERKNLTIRL